MSSPRPALLMTGGGINPPWNEVVNLTRFYNASLTNVSTKGNNFSALSTTGFNSTRVKWANNSGFQAGTNGLGWETASHADYTIGTANFVFEWWMWNTTHSLQNNGVKVWIDCRGSVSPLSNIPIFYTTTTNGGLSYNVSGGADLITSAAGVIANNTAYQHIAYCRNGTSGRLFVNGIQVGSATDNTNYVQCPLRISTTAAHSAATGMYISDFRFAIGSGSGIYTANFAPPTAPFPTY